MVNGEGNFHIQHNLHNVHEGLLANAYCTPSSEIGTMIRYSMKQSQDARRGLAVTLKEHTRIEITIKKRVHSHTGHLHTEHNQSQHTRA